MRLTNLMIVTMLAMSPVASGADTTDRSSPVDKNAACMDRMTDAATGNCVVKDEGTPRHTYPPKKSPASPAPASSSERKSATGK